MCSSVSFSLYISLSVLSPWISLLSTVSLVSVSHMCSGMYLRTFTCLFHSVFPILFLSCAVSSRYCSTPLQESQRMQTKLDALTREVFDLQETINWKDKKIGVGGLKLVLRQSVERQRCWTFLPFNNSFASHTVSAWWRPLGSSTCLDPSTFTIGFLHVITPGFLVGIPRYTAAVHNVSKPAVK